MKKIIVSISVFLITLSCQSYSPKISEETYIDPIDKYEEVKNVKGSPYDIYLSVDLLKRTKEINLYYQIVVKGPSRNNPFERTNYDPSSYVKQIKDILGLDKFNITEVKNKRYSNYTLAVDYEYYFIDHRSKWPLSTFSNDIEIDYQLIDNSNTSVIAQNHYSNMDFISVYRNTNKKTKLIKWEWNQQKPTIFAQTFLKGETDLLPVIMFFPDKSIPESIKEKILFVFSVYKSNGFFINNLETNEKSPNMPGSNSFALALIVNDELDRDTNSIFVHVDLYGIVNDKFDLDLYWRGAARIPTEYYRKNPYYYLEKIALLFPKQLDNSLVDW